MIIGVTRSIHDLMLVSPSGNGGGSISIAGMFESALVSRVKTDSECALVYAIDARALGGRLFSGMRVKDKGST